MSSSFLDFFYFLGLFPIQLLSRDDYTRRILEGKTPIRLSVLVIKLVLILLSNGDVADRAGQRFTSISQGFNLSSRRTSNPYISK